MNKLKLRQSLQQFLLEDIGDKDVTSEVIFPVDKRGKGQIVVKESGVISGVEVIKEGYSLLNEEVEVTLLKKDGDEVEKGEIIATVNGPMIHLLTGERVILNLLQRMSGIATLTKNAVRALNSPHTRICDTRKTTPGLRMFEKYAVTCGDGYNHRFGLYDGAMIKDNHIAFCGSITEAVKATREKLGHMVKIEVETESRAAVLEAVEAQVDVIMFDNRTPEEVSEFVTLVPKTIITEASGGIILDCLSKFGDTGVDYISLGFLTHSVKAMDISFQV